MLDRILPSLPKTDHPDLLVGPNTLDDAGVFRINEREALVQTLDFFTPIVDDAYDFGRVAAANSLSDVYAMGGRPLTAMNIVAFPDDKLPEEVLAEILRGAAAVCNDAEVAVVGGHSVSDPELKFGLSVTGMLDLSGPILANSGAKPGDVLFLTKPLGSGLISNAMMNEVAEESHISAMVETMVRLNRNAAESAVQAGACGATDITGFGLLGHTREMAIASGVTIELFANQLPLIDGAMAVAASGSYYSGGERRNLQYVEKDLTVAANVSDEWLRIMSDPQTSGGLLITLAPESAQSFQEEMQRRGETAWMIGHATEGEPGKIIVYPSIK